MFRWYVRYLPYAVVFWLCRRHSERFFFNGCSLVATMPFKGEIVGWSYDPATPKPEDQSHG